MVHAGHVFVAGIHPSRTWMSGSFWSVQWNACVHRLDLGLYSHPKTFWGNGARTHVCSKGKIPSSKSAEEDQTHVAASRRTASPTHYRLSYPGALLLVSFSFHSSFTSSYCFLSFICTYIFCSTLLCSSLCPSTAGSSPPPESSSFVFPSLSLSFLPPVAPQFISPTMLGLPTDFTPFVICHSMPWMIHLWYEAYICIGDKQIVNSLLLTVSDCENTGACCVLGNSLLMMYGCTIRTQYVNRWAACCLQYMSEFTWGFCGSRL